MKSKPTQAEIDLIDELFVLISRNGFTTGAVTEAFRHYMPLIEAAIRTNIDDEWPRWFLFEACPHDGKYGDDGEMQCHGVDFQRDDLWRLQQHVAEAVGNRNVEVMAARGDAIDMRVKYGDLQRRSSERIEHLEDLLKNIYTGRIGFSMPNEPEIQQIRKEFFS